MRRKFLNLLPFVVLPALWMFYPEQTSWFIDTADTEHYVDFRSNVGFRLIVVAIVKFFASLGFQPVYAALFFNSIGVIYLMLLIEIYWREFHMGEERKRWIVLAIVASSPLVILSKNVMSTDLYAGIVLTHALLILEKIRRQCREGGSPGLSHHVWAAFLILLSLNLKSTAALGFLAYILAFLIWERGRLVIHVKSIGKLFAAGFVFWLGELMIYYLVYGDPWYRYLYEFAKSKGGNAPHEIAGTRQSIPVPLFLYHIYSHLKFIGRSGLPGVLVIPALWMFRRNFFALVYFFGLVIYSVIAIRGYLTMERYFAVFVPCQLILFAEFYRRIQSGPHLRRFAIPMLVFGPFVSLLNYLFRYFPEMYQKAGDLF